MFHTFTLAQAELVHQVTLQPLEVIYNSSLSYETDDVAWYSYGE